MVCNHLLAVYLAAVRRLGFSLVLVLAQPLKTSCARFDAPSAVNKERGREALASLKRGTIQQGKNKKQKFKIPLRAALS